MFNVQDLVIQEFVKKLKKSYQQTYNLLKPEYGNIIAWAGQLALENIANSDALYHNVEHTIQVTMVGQAILRGKHLCEGGIFPEDWLHITLALLCHDIGYVRGICKADEGNVVATGINDELVTLSPCGTDASLQPYHVDRSKLFVRERFGGKLLNEVVNPKIIEDYIEMTRFPPPQDNFHQGTSGYGSLVRAADFIGQLGDIKYRLKIPALFYEFEETGMNETNGYTCPDDMRRSYADFYWKVVHHYIQDALRYLRITQEGKQWIATLHAHVFDSEHNERLL